MTTYRFEINSTDQFNKKVACDFSVTAKSEPTTADVLSKFAATYQGRMLDLSTAEVRRVDSFAPRATMDVAAWEAGEECIGQPEAAERDDLTLDVESGEITGGQ